MTKYYLGILISLLFFNQLFAKNIDIQENLDLSFKCEVEKKIIKNSEYNYQVFLAKDLKEKDLSKFEIKSHNLKILTLMDCHHFFLKL